MKFNPIKKMIKKTIRSIFKIFGYEVKPLSYLGQYNKAEQMKLVNYINSDGSLDYEKYVKIQTEGNKSKINLVWVVEENIKFLANYIKQMLSSPKFGICHGTRQGKEQEWFKKYINDCQVIGTEISATAKNFPDTIQWDFHEVKPEWINSVDFIYSNSFDHSYDPEKCLNAWMSCLRQGGMCIIEHSSLHGPSAVTELDPFGAEIYYMPYLITLWENGSYGVRQILKAPQKNDKIAEHFGASIEYLYFIVIQKF
jgi:hypothetical protein